MSSTFALAALVAIGSSVALVQPPPLHLNDDVDTKSQETPASPTVTALGTLHPELWRLPTTVTWLRIVEGFSGMAMDAPFGSRYTLRRDGFAFVGEAEYSAGGYWREQQETSAPTGLADTEVMEFLDEIARTPVREGVENAPVVLDAYYDMSIRLVTDNGDVVIRTESAFGEHVPWNIQYGERRYTSRSATLYRSYQRLLKSLPHDQLKTLREAVVRSPSKP